MVMEKDEVVGGSEKKRVLGIVHGSNRTIFRREN